jgi:UDPglucose 6-dehydrogenase
MHGEARQMLPGVEFCASASAAMEGADAMALLTEWNEFRALDPARIRQLLRSPVVIDLRNVYSPADMAAAGIAYHSVGRPATAVGGAS